MLPTAIAPSADLATPRVHRVAKKIASNLEPATLVEFYVCCPCTFSVEDHKGNHWIEGCWGAVIESDRFNLRWLEDMRMISHTVSIDEVDITARDGILILEFTLSARVLRW